MPNLTRPASIRIAVIAFALGVSACAKIPPLVSLPPADAAARLKSEKSFAAPLAAFPVDRWWEGFNDPQLTALIDEGLANAPSIAAASARMRIAAALAQQSGALTGPSASADATITGDKLTRNQGFPPQFIPQGVLDNGRVTASVTFDPDLWGKNRATLAAATSEAQASIVDLAQARLMLATSITDTYALLGLRHIDRGIAGHTLAVQEATVALTKARVKQGLDTLAELRIADARVAATRAELGGIDQAISTTQNRIAALIGAGPDRGLAITPPAASGSQSFGLPDQLALNLVGRRPDLVAARLRVEAAASRIKVARTDFYPNINLTALVGLQSLGLDQLISGGSTIARFGPAISLPIFDGGRRQARYDQARAQFDADVAHYDDVLVGALRQTADAVTVKRAIGGQLVNARAALVASEDARRIVELRYKNGLANQLQLLAAEDAMTASRKIIVGLESQEVAATIALIAALGGGFVEGPKQ
ncbi:MAG: efflux transporter outer membrane subunit [Sphingomonadaceae bacterium]